MVGATRKKKRDKRDPKNRSTKKKHSYRCPHCKEKIEDSIFKNHRLPCPHCGASIEDFQLKKKNEHHLHCSICQASFGYPRLKSGEWVCRSCGGVTKIDVDKLDQNPVESRKN